MVNAVSGAAWPHGGRGSRLPVRRRQCRWGWAMCNDAQAKASARASADSAGVGHLGSMVGMVPADPRVGGAAARLDHESAEWLRVLGEAGPRREAALARLHELLVRIARGEVARRGPRLRISGPELDDLACQAAADALLAITSKLGQFRGESRFTTWACKFVIFEVSAKIGRHFWRHPSVPMDAEDWDRLPGHFGFDPAYQAEWRELFVRRDRAQRCPAGYPGPFAGFQPQRDLQNVVRRPA